MNDRFPQKKRTPHTHIEKPTQNPTIGKIKENPRLRSADVDIVEAVTNQSFNQKIQTRSFNTIGVGDQNNRLGTLGIRIGLHSIRRGGLGGFIVALGGVVFAAALSVEQDLLQIGDEAWRQEVVLHRSRHQ
uniref:Uncharacterized protein n=1 Tax=Vitis vinifera TaxID=29760 RepID=A5C2M5_VITVI|nr:hypothetical protein VITISV_000575 [Vitis vinifera]